MRLGKREYRPDERTVKLAAFLDPVEPVPAVFDHDKGRSPFPISSWGNDQYGNCVIAGRCNHTLRIERIERRNTPNISPPDVVEEYKRESMRQFGQAPQTAGDPYDQGLYVLEALKDWRGDGWPVLPTRRSKKARQQTIAAFGELNRNDREQLRAGIFTLHGVQMGLSLPRSASTQLRNKQAWDSVPTDAWENQPGSWGGHLVYCKRYDEGGIYCLTWGKEQYMTNAFVERYCDEAWAVVDNIERADRALDVEALIKYLRDIGAGNIE